MMNEHICLLGKQDYIQLIGVWEASVRATHHFLKEDEILFYRKAISDSYFDNVELYGIRDSTTADIKAFIGLSASQVEMLFVHPDYRRQHLGAQLISFALREKNIMQVDVNEENKQALDFYLHLGYQITGRDETDAEGKNHPILHLHYTMGE